MKLQHHVLFALTMVLMCVPMQFAEAVGHGRGHSVGRGHGGRGHGISNRSSHGFGRGGGFGFNAFYDDGWDLAELYRELLNNVPYYALHPPVYYSYPVPRTYGYSPFAYPPSVLTPEVEFQPTAVQIINPYVPQEKSAEATTDRAASAATQPEPLVITNPFIAPARSVAQQ